MRLSKIKNKLKAMNLVFMVIMSGFNNCKTSPNDLKAERSLIKAIEISKKLNRPIFINFTRYTLGYDEFHYELVTSKKILKKLNEKFITLELYTDSPKKIQSNDTLGLYKLDFLGISKERIKRSKTIGQMNSIIEEYWLKGYYQPLYIIIDSETNILVKPFGYTSKNKILFLKKLEEGLRKFNES